MSQPARELELKFEVALEELKQIQLHPTLANLAISRPLTRTLRTVYYDTRDHKLHRSGYSVRLRKVGRLWVQTVKAQTALSGGVSNPIEIESNVKTPRISIDAVTDKSARKHVRELAGRSRLMPQFETVVKRTSQLIKSSEGGQIEVAFDQCVVRSPKGRRTFFEVELELKAGNSAMLLSAAEALFTNRAIRLSTLRKSDQGFVLIDGGSRPKVAAVYASLPKIATGQTTADALHEIFRVTTAQALENWRAVPVIEDPAVAHQMRVGLRRVRTAFKMFRPVLNPPIIGAIQASARDLARIVGSLRDYDVLASEIVGPLAAHDRTHGLPHLLSHLNAARDVRHRNLVQEVQRVQWTSLQLRLAMLPEVFNCFTDKTETARLAEPIDEVAKPLLARLWRRVERRCKRLDDLNIAERHDLRKDLKTLRYAVEFMAPLYGKRRTALFLKRLKPLLEILGYLNDVAVAEKLTLILANSTAMNPELQRAVGFAIGWHTARSDAAWLEVRSTYEQLSKFEKFWT